MLVCALYRIARYKKALSKYHPSNLSVGWNEYVCFPFRRASNQMMNVTDRRLYKEKMITHLAGTHWDFFVSLSFNRYNISLYQASDNLRSFDAQTSRASAGSKWARQSHCRPLFWAFLEKTDCNLHYHLVVSIKRPRDAEAYVEAANRAWPQLVSSGTIDIKPVRDQKNVTAYVAKSVGFDVNFEHFVVPGAFWSR